MDPSYEIYKKNIRVHFKKRLKSRFKIKISNVHYDLLSNSLLTNPSVGESADGITTVHKMKINGKTIYVLFSERYCQMQTCVPYGVSWRKFLYGKKGVA